MDINSALWLKQLKAIPRLINQSQYKLLNWGALGYVFLGILLALTLPDDGFNRYPLVDVFCSKMETLIPSIDQFEQASSFRNVTRTYLSIMWALIPAMSLLMIVSIGYSSIFKLVFKNFWQDFLKNIIFSICAALLCLAMIFIFAVMPVDIEAKVNSNYMTRSNAVLTFMSHSKFGLGLAGSLINLSVAFFAHGITAYIYMLFLLCFGFFKRILFLKGVVK